MKRSDFLKRLGIGIGAVVVAPRVLAEMPTKEEKLTYTLNPNNYESKIREYPLTKDECYTDVNWKIPRKEDYESIYNHTNWYWEWDKNGNRTQVFV